MVLIAVQFPAAGRVGAGGVTELLGMTVTQVVALRPPGAAVTGTSLTRCRTRFGGVPAMACCSWEASSMRPKKVKLRCSWSTGTPTSPTPKERLNHGAVSLTDGVGETSVNGAGSAAGRAAAPEGRAPASTTAAAASRLRATRAQRFDTGRG